MRRKRDYTPLSWQDYFDSMKDVYVNGKDVSFHQRCACIETKSFDGETGEDCEKERNLSMTLSNILIVINNSDGIFVNCITGWSPNVMPKRALRSYVFVAKVQRLNADQWLH